LAYYKKILEDTVRAVNLCFEKHYYEINVRRVRKCNAISSSERSKINFISRALDDLSNLGYLKYIGKNSPKKYEILKKLDLNEIKDILELK